jgi:hypothetical protein
MTTLEKALTVAIVIFCAAFIALCFYVKVYP